MKTRVGLLLVILTLAGSMVFAIGSKEKILSTKLHFNEAAPKSAEPVTLVLTPEFLAVSREHKILFARYTFDIGEAVGANLQRALEANYRTVSVVPSADQVKTKLFVEPKFYSFDTTLPGTAFGTYKAALKLGFVIRDRSRKTENEHVENVTGTDKRRADIVLFDIQYMRDNNSNERRLGIASNDAIKQAIDGLLVAMK
jgi:hypothetical protein